VAETAAKAVPARTAVRLTLAGHVQGVGFRPFVYRLARELGISGTVQNRLGEVEVIAAGSEEQLARLQRELISRAPPLSRPAIVGAGPAEPPEATGFAILASEGGTDARVFVPPDYFMCDDCAAELADPADRRHDYPFINCTQCGPRYTLIERLPYDRGNTSMAAFPLCRACDAEYRDPGDRRFHAEPVACPECGPSLTFERPGEPDIANTTTALDAAVAALREGQVVAVRGIGGYHLMCDACDPMAVNRLRERKRRPDKPLAVMIPLAGRDGLDGVRRFVKLDSCEAAIASGPARPIVLARKRAGCGLADNIAPGLGEIGVFLPYSPLHHLLLQRFGGPLVATSGNISGEPVLTDNCEAAQRLGGVADVFLQHNRPIVRPADDPVYRRIAGRVRPLRMGRGTAPVELALPGRVTQPVLCTGGQMKGTVALAWDDRVVVSPHIGEMDSPRSLRVFEQVAADLQALYGVRATRIACDAHPGYTTTRWARGRGLPVAEVWHHEAHASALAAEHAVDAAPWLVFAWDGVGLGHDGTLWGGEALLGRPGDWLRVGSLRRFRLPGGDRAGREPWRSAAALLWEVGLEWTECPDDHGLARAAWDAGLNCPETSAAGRLFDAAAALICGRLATSFEAQGPMELEALCRHEAEPVTLGLDEVGGVSRIDWAPLLPVMTDTSLDPGERAGIVHASVAAALVAQAAILRERHGVGRVGLTGGVFQNRVLAGLVTRGLSDGGFEVSLPERMPCNDAALSFGQAVEFQAKEASD